MKLCVSNIAWNSQFTEQAYSILKKYDIKGVDIAPTLINKNIDRIIPTDLLNSAKKYNLKLVGMQSLLYSCPNISLFDGEQEKEIILKHLLKVFKLAKKLKIKKLVFGSPKNRFIKNTKTFKLDNAVKIFRNISNLAKTYNCIICFEANPINYNCNFITNTLESIDFVKLVNHKNFKLNLDISTVILNNEDLENILRRGIKLIEHMHISSPFLKNIYKINNKNISFLIKKYKYNKWIALECNFQDKNDLLEFKKNVAIFSEAYN